MSQLSAVLSRLIPWTCVAASLHFGHRFWRPEVGVNSWPHLQRFLAYCFGISSLHKSWYSGRLLHHTFENIGVAIPIAQVNQMNRPAPAQIVGLEEIKHAID